MGISSVLLLGSTGLAQVPPIPVPPTGSTGAPTTWEPYSSTLPIPKPENTQYRMQPITPNLPNATRPNSIGSRVVTYQKPAGQEEPNANGDSKKVAPAATDSTPNRADVFRLSSESELESRILEQLPENKELGFPKLPDVTRPGSVIGPRLGSNPLTVALEPGYVTHRRLYFEELNSERYGWNLGMVQPLVSTVHFYKDVLLWPSRLTSNVWERYDTNAGKCLPGSPVPYYLYPPELTIHGGFWGAVTFVGMGFILP